MNCGFVQDFGTFVRAEHRRQEISEIVRTAPNSRRGHPAADYGEHGERHQRPKHAPGRFVSVHLVLVVARLPVKSKKDQTEHVKRSEQGSKQSKNVQRMSSSDLKSAQQDGILAEKSGKRRNARNRQGGDEHGRVGVLDLLAEAAHVPYVLLAAHGVNHGTSSEKEQRLEKGMRHQ